MNRAHSIRQRCDKPTILQSVDPYKGLTGLHLGSEAYMFASGCGHWSAPKNPIHFNAIAESES
jgi:hypothetical protein